MQANIYSDSKFIVQYADKSRINLFILNPCIYSCLLIFSIFKRKLKGESIIRIFKVQTVAHLLIPLRSKFITHANTLGIYFYFKALRQTTNIRTFITKIYHDCIMMYQILL